MTMAMLCLNIETGVGYYINAGHDPIYRFIDGTAKGIIKPGSPLGVQEDAVYDPVEFRLKKGESLFLFTDGLIENSGPDNKRLKRRDLFRILEQTKDIAEIKQKILSAGEKIWKDQPPDDDCTFLILKWLGNR